MMTRLSCMKCRLDFRAHISDYSTYTHIHTQTGTPTNLHTSANKVDDFNHHNMLRTQTHPQGANQLLQRSHTHTHAHTPPYTERQAHNQAKPILVFHSDFINRFLRYVFTRQCCTALPRHNTSHPDRPTKHTGKTHKATVTPSFSSLLF